MAPTGTSEARPIVISAPSGAGKSTIVGKLIEKYPDMFELVISHTTRQPRGQEQHGREYYFVTVPEFQEKISQTKEGGGFVEHAQFGSNYYGTSVDAISSIEKKGIVPILDIEMEGVKQIHKHPKYDKQARFLFLSPPSLDILEKRLRGRGTDKEDAIQKRLAQAKHEIEYSKTSGAHDRIVVNDDLEKAWKEVEDWVFEEVEGRKP